jgi:hypothetical protein
MSCYFIETFLNTLPVSCSVATTRNNEKYIEIYLRSLHVFTARCSGKIVIFFVASILSLTSFYSQHVSVKLTLMCGLEVGVILWTL